MVRRFAFCWLATIGVTDGMIWRGSDPFILIDMGVFVAVFMVMLALWDFCPDIRYWKDEQGRHLKVERYGR